MSLTLFNFKAIEASLAYIQGIQQFSESRRETFL